MSGSLMRGTDSDVTVVERAVTLEHVEGNSAPALVAAAHDEHDDCVIFR
jgi:hypothetical protein